MSEKQPGQPTGEQRRPKRLLVMLAVVAIVSVGYVAVRHYFSVGREIADRQAVTPPSIGGPFTLVDQHGKTVTDADFRGKFMLVYFGYTYCPDICPTSLSRNSDALDLLGDKADQVVPILITVDPARDTPEQLKEYATFFHPRLVALGGTDEQVAAAAKAYRVYFAKVHEEGADPDVYLMDHTSITYLMGPDGRFVQHFSHDTSPEPMAERIGKLIDARQ